MGANKDVIVSVSGISLLGIMFQNGLRFGAPLRIVGQCINKVCYWWGFGIVSLLRIRKQSLYFCDKAIFYFRVRFYVKQFYQNPVIYLVEYRPYAFHVWHEFVNKNLKFQ